MQSITREEVINNMFYLTKHNSVEITSFEDLFTKYANNWVCDRDVNTPGIDDFGRNQTDRIFLILCLGLWSHVELCDPDNPILFISLTCQKNEDNKHIVRVELNTETIEGELLDVYYHYEDLRVAQIQKQKEKEVLSSTKY